MKNEVSNDHKKFVNEFPYLFQVKESHLISAIRDTFGYFGNVNEHGPYNERVLYFEHHQLAAIRVKLTKGLSTANWRLVGEKFRLAINSAKALYLQMSDNQGNPEDPFKYAYLFSRNYYGFRVVSFKKNKIVSNFNAEKVHGMYRDLCHVVEILKGEVLDNSDYDEMKTLLGTIQDGFSTYSGVFTFQGFTFKVYKNNRVDISSVTGSQWENIRVLQNFVVMHIKAIEGTNSENWVKRQLI
jgi:hypothetical protein